MSDGGAEKLVTHDGDRVAPRIGKWLDDVAQQLLFLKNHCILRSTSRRCGDGPTLTIARSYSQPARQRPPSNRLAS